MKYLLALLSLALVGCAQNKPDLGGETANNLRLKKAQHLYSCFSFFSNGSKVTTDPEQRAKLGRVSNMFLTKATIEVVAADEDKDPSNTQLAKKYGQLGQKDFRDFMTSVDKLKSEKERTDALNGFTNSCAKEVGVQ
jgi:hypothetical protein